MNKANKTKRGQTEKIEIKKLNPLKRKNKQKQTKTQTCL